MTALAILGGGFLLAVLWMDLMFDVQVLAHRDLATLPEEVLASIASYYRRVTTLARPMGHAIGAVMGITLVVVVCEILAGGSARWLDAASLPFCAGPIVLAGARVLPNAVRLGSRADAAAEQTRLARAICRDHLVCLAGIAVFAAMQLARALMTEVR